MQPHHRAGSSPQEQSGSIPFARMFAPGKKIPLRAGLPDNQSFILLRSHHVSSCPDRYRPDPAAARVYRAA